MHARRHRVRLALHRDIHRGLSPRKPVGGEKKESLLLRRQAIRLRQVLRHALRQAPHAIRLLRFLRQREHASEVTARRLVVVAGVGVADRRFRLIERRLRTSVVADHVERRADLCFRQRAFDTADPVVVQVAQPRLVHAARLREHIGSVSHRAIHQFLLGVVAVAALIDFEVIARRVTALANRKLLKRIIRLVERRIRHDIASPFARNRKSVA